jgi:glycerol-3-phosphate dehydrogenase subunit B
LGIAKMVYDVVIIGAGLAGMTAALKALQQGMKTIVVSAGASAMESMSGCLDLCGSAEKPWPALRSLVSENPGHPYALLKEEEIHEALLFFVEQTKGSCPYHYQDGFNNFCIPTAFGNQRYTCLLPEGQLAAAAAEGRVLVVGLKGYRDFCAELMVEGMQKRGFKGWQAAEVDLDCLQLPGSGAADSSRSLNNLNNNVEIAVRLENSWQLLAEELSGKVRGFGSIAFPALLGLSQHLQVKRGLEESLGVKVFEVPTLPPSLPGMRLARTLTAGVRLLGGDLLQGFPVAAADLKGRICSSVIVNTPGRPRRVKGKSFILATGGVLGGGIQVERERVSEVVFHFPVSKPASEAYIQEISDTQPCGTQAKHNLADSDAYIQEDPHDTQRHWQITETEVELGNVEVTKDVTENRSSVILQAVPSGDENRGQSLNVNEPAIVDFSQLPTSDLRHQTSIFKAGVRANKLMQPLAVDGGVLLENVFCAGRILAGYDPFIEGSGAGVAIATGYRAAVEAGMVAEDE